MVEQSLQEGRADEEDERIVAAREEIERYRGGPEEQ
jgi:hypothetical protein